MTAVSPCPLCGQTLPTDGPAGVCPACVLRLGLETHAAGSARGKAPEPAELAAAFPQLEILELLGQGGMGIVYKARQRSLDRLVALKILSLDAGADPAFEERFARESRTLAQLTHPNIAAVFDSGKAGGLFYLVMEYVDGVNLRTAIATRALVPADALAVVRQVCDALQHAHDAGVVHRDIKPENILLDSRGRVRIADFGLAKLLGRTPIDISLTATHQVLGTFRYMAPEQIERPMSVDHRADIYSLGVVLYELLTGELPVGRFALPSERGTLDAGLDRVVLRALEHDPVRRYQHASELKTDVTSVPAEEPAPTAAPGAPVMTVRFWEALSGHSTSKGLLELYDDRVSFDFEVISKRGQRTIRTVQVPLNRVRSAAYWQSHFLGVKIVQLLLDRGPWTAQLPFCEVDRVRVQVGSKEEGESLAAAINERVAPPSEETGILKIFPKAFSSTFSVTDESLRPIAGTVNLSWWPNIGEFTVHGVTYRARREGVVSGAYLLESPDCVVARATKPSALRRSLIVVCSGRQYTLRAASAWRREFLLLEGSTRIGAISREGFFTRRAAADLPSTLPLAVRVFIIWLTVMLWRRDRSM